MTARKPRPLTLGSLVYLWRVHHRHRVGGTPNCVEVFTAFHQEHPRKPVRILFPETSEHGPGFPSQSGVVVDYQRPRVHLNLNRPLLARLLIELAVVSGWAPGSADRELVIANGYHLLRKHQRELDAALSADDDPTRGPRQ